ncbi:hypothetical protein [Flammeovirga sp. EKP202]|uniref:hypothetical protein n=1 Tax=Flammeovirga sp. EKP202 TaxID=2770592 RepID=UPI00165F980D|nr:hypothetical protein [Flammeovirga sp. EKP202]MBD0403376.1 hypothetical protein [Flammeovirga sp. EKP202]
MVKPEKVKPDQNRVNKENAPFIFACAIQLFIILLNRLDFIPKEAYNSISLFTTGIIFSSIYYTTVINNDKEALANLKHVGISLVIVILFVGSIIYGLI